MRRPRARLFALLVVAACSLHPAGALAATATLFGAPPRNFVKNSGFDDADAWILKGPETYWQERGGREGGAIHYRGAPGSDAEVVQTVGTALAPGQRYILSAWVRALEEGAVAVVGARWERGHPQIFRSVHPDEGWVRIELRFEAPMEPGWRQIVLSGTGRLLWDDVTLYEAFSLESQLAAEWEKMLESGAPIYTGLVVNALGTDLERGMSPKIYSEDGSLLFAGTGAGDDQLIQTGIVAYATDLRQATLHPRLRVSEAYPLRLPLVVDAQGTRGTPRTDVIVGAADAALIREAVNHYDFFGRFAIVIVVEPFSGI